MNKAALSLGPQILSPGRFAARERGRDRVSVVVALAQWPAHVRSRVQERIGAMSLAAKEIDLTVVPLPARLRAFRRGRGLSLDTMSGMLGVPLYTLRRWEVGASRPGADNAVDQQKLGFEIDASETNATSRSRIKADPNGQAPRHLVLPESDGLLAGATEPSWMKNGPPDQDGFHEKLIGLQIDPLKRGMFEPQRLSLIDEVSPGEKTYQSLLEAPKAKAASWNSNYGSHGWHRYIGRFPPHLVRALLNHFGAQPGSVVLDPFAGSGTTAVECRLLGLRFVGVEICALSHLMCRTKAGFVPDASLLAALAQRYEDSMSAFCDAALKALPENFQVADVLAMDGNVLERFTNIEKWFTPEALLGVQLTMQFGKQLAGFERDALHLALSAKMRSIGNLDVDVVRAEYSKKPRADVNVGRLVTAQLKKMGRNVAEMTASHAPTLGPPTDIRVIEGSALDVEIPEASVDYVITSPPYGVEAISYLRTHLLSYRSLSSVLSHDPYETRDQTIGSEYLEESKLPDRLEVAGVSPTFVAYFGSLPPSADKNTRLRQMAMMKFFEDMHHIGKRLAMWMKDDGKAAFVVGNKRLGETVVPTDAIIEESFASSGLELYDAIRHKLKTNNSNSQVPWQERIIQEEATLLFKRRARS
jgi:DNA modification methylase